MGGKGGVSLSSPVATDSLQPTIRKSRTSNRGRARFADNQIGTDNGQQTSRMKTHRTNARLGAQEGQRNPGVVSALGSTSNRDTTV